MLMTVTAIYGICWIPNLILYVVWYFALETDAIYTINKIFLVLILVNSCANPIAYALYRDPIQETHGKYFMLMPKAFWKSRKFFYSFQKMGRNYKYI